RLRRPRPLLLAPPPPRPLLRLALRRPHAARDGPAWRPRHGAAPVVHPPSAVAVLPAGRGPLVRRDRRRRHRAQLAGRGLPDGLTPGTRAPGRTIRRRQGPGTWRCRAPLVGTRARGASAHFSSALDRSSTRRAITSCWICWVPSKMSRILESRDHFSRKLRSE